MARLNWDAIGERFYESGVDRGVLYPSVGPGLAWNGLFSVTESPSGDFETKYLDGLPYRKPLASGEFSAKIEAYTYPDEFEEYAGWSGLQNPTRLNFGFAYRTFVSSDSKTDLGYKIHLVYNATASPSEHSHNTLENDYDLSTFAWDVTTKPVYISGLAPSSHLIVDSTKTHAQVLAKLEDVIYGSPTSDPYLPSIQEVIDIFEINSLVRIVDNDDGTWTVSGPDDLVFMTGPDIFQIETPNVVFLDNSTYNISSY